MTRPATRGFTLIELLVVVTIIVILLAMLTPALDKAIYRAELVTCSAKLKAIASGMSIYTVDHKRWFPYNWRLANGQTTQPTWVGETGSAFDMRPLLRPYMSINKTLIDPMIRAYELDQATWGINHGSYSLWNGWGWLSRASAVSKYQNKLGDRMHYQAYGGVGAEYSWDIIASDCIKAYPTTASWTYWSNHPSKNDTSRLVKAEGAWASDIAGGPLNSTGIVYSHWISNIPQRDEQDFNIARQDGSVQTLGDVKWNDERLVANVWGGPSLWSGYEEFAGHQLPTR